MKEYIISLMGAVVTASVILEIIPDGVGKKWVRLAAGLAVACTIFQPIHSLFSAGKLQTEELVLPQAEQRYLMDEVERQLAENISSAIWENLQKKVETLVYAKTDAEGNFAGVSRVEIIPYSSAVAEYVASLLEIPQDKVVEG